MLDELAKCPWSETSLTTLERELQIKKQMRKPSRCGMRSFDSSVIRKHIYNTKVIADTVKGEREEEMTTSPR